MRTDHEIPDADHVFDGGNMDCGSGLILLIRQNMLEVTAGGILEIRSSEPTVLTELPPWCRMVGHEHILSLEYERGQWRHFVKRGTATEKEKSGLDADKVKVAEYKWSLRARRTNITTIYSRNFSWTSDQSISFDRQGDLPTALEQFFGSILSDLIGCFVSQCSQRNIQLDDLEATLHGTLNDPIAAIGGLRGDASVKEIKVTAFASSSNPENDIRDAWDSSCRISPVLQTVTKACHVDLRLVLI